MIYTMRQLQKQIHDTAKAHGWWDDFDKISTSAYAHYLGAKLALIHSEISEALEELRKTPTMLITYYKTDSSGGEDKPEGFGIELADAVIRIMDLCAVLDIDLERCIEEKMAYNKTRSHRHGGKAL